MNLIEKCRLIALYGDISDFNRERWLHFIAVPPETILLYHPDRIVCRLNDGRIAVRRNSSLFDGDGFQVP